MCFQIFYLECQSPLQMLLSAHPLRLCTPRWCAAQLSDSSIVDLKTVWSSTGQFFPPSISLYFTFECIIVLCWCHSTTLYPQSFIAVTEIPLRLWHGDKIQSSLQDVRRTGARGVWKASAPSFNKFTPGLSITLLTTCQERAWPEATLTEPTADSPVAWMCSYWHWVNEFV